MLSYCSAVAVVCIERCCLNSMLRNCVDWRSSPGSALQCNCSERILSRTAQTSRMHYGSRHLCHCCHLYHGDFQEAATPSQAFQMVSTLHAGCLSWIATLISLMHLCPLQFHAKLPVFKDNEHFFSFKTQKYGRPSQKRLSIVFFTFCFSAG